MSEMFYPVLSKETILPFLVTGIGVDYVQGDIDRQKTGHETAQFIFTSSGEGRLIMDGIEYKMTENTVLYLPKGYPHEYHPIIKNKWRTYWICFNGCGVSALLKQFGLYNAKFMEILSTHHIESVMKKILQILKSDRIYGNYYASAYLYELFIETNKQINNFVSETDFNADHRIVAVINYLEECYSQKISLQTLCSVSNLSEQHLCRLFKKYFNTRPMEYLEKLRINEAKKILMTTNRAVQKIAFDVGYDNSAYFSKIFRKHENITPTEFRLRIK